MVGNTRVEKVEDKSKSQGQQVKEQIINARTNEKAADRVESDRKTTTKTVNGFHLEDERIRENSQGRMVKEVLKCGNRVKRIYI